MLTFSLSFRKLVRWKHVTSDWLSEWLRKWYLWIGVQTVLMNAFSREKSQFDVDLNCSSVRQKHTTLRRRQFSNGLALISIPFGFNKIDDHFKISLPFIQSTIHYKRWFSTGFFHLSYSSTYADDDVPVLLN